MSSTAAATSAASAPVAKLTAACPLLSANELQTLLNGKNKVTATEDDKIHSGYTNYECNYGSNGKNSFSLVVLGIAQEGYTPTVSIDAVAKGSGVKTHSVTGVGETAVFYTTTDGTSVLAAAKQSFGETRTVIFGAPVVVPEDKFVDVEKLVIDRI